MPSEISLFRKALAVVQIGYYVSLFPRMHEFFGASGWVQSENLDEYSSLLLLSDSEVWRWGLLAVIFILLVQFFRGKLNRFGLLVLYILNLAFYRWNPLIIHEPQPLMNLFFLSFFILPMSDEGKADPWIKNALITFLGVYYFLAGIKKLPDPNFLKGVALEDIISWSVMAKNIHFNMFLVKYLVWPIRLMNYLTLIFEIGFIFFVFTRFRVYLILFGVLLHALIYMTLEVGNFSFVMMAWYMLLLDENTINWFKKKRA